MPGPATVPILWGYNQGNGVTLEELYDPDNEFIYSDLTKAHKALDKAVEEAYGVDFDGDEQKIVAHLFDLYAERTQS